jgi:hypothetical protein
VPFTPAHAAAALPISRRLPRLPLAALVVGTMAPDFEYLLRLAPRGGFGHTPLGLVVFTFPAGVLAWAAYVRLVRPAVTRLLPPGLARALGPAPRATVGAVALAVLVGAVSHVAWDGFTHPAGWAVARLPVLLSPVAPGSRLAWYTLLQHASTVVGGAVVVGWALRWVRRQPRGARRYPPGGAGRAGSVAVGLAAFALAAGALNALRAQPTTVSTVAGYAVVGAMTGLVVALLAYGARLGAAGAPEPL